MPVGVILEVFSLSRLPRFMEGQHFLRAHKARQVGTGGARARRDEEKRGGGGGVTPISTMEVRETDW